VTAKKIPDWKQGPPIVDPDAGKAKIEAEGSCRLCRRIRLPRWLGGNPFDCLERHHLVPRGTGKTIGGDDLDENLIPLCTRCHRAVEDRERWARMAVRANLQHDEEDYVIRKKGKWWLDKNYPATGAP